MTDPAPRSRVIRDGDRVPDITDDELLRLAYDATANSYVAYSGFPVGAALLLDDGTVVTGCNVENASYGLTICAERNACFHMVSAHGPGSRIAACAIAGRLAAPCPPCGACRQVLHEFGCRRVILEESRPGGDEIPGAGGREVGVVKLGAPVSIDFADILPHSFGPDDLS